VARLAATEEGQGVLPEGWGELWSALLAARHHTARRGS
jgi:hypothetical protein